MGDQKFLGAGITIAVTCCLLLILAAAGVLGGIGAWVLDEPAGWILATALFLIAAALALLVVYRRKTARRESNYQKTELSNSKGRK